MRKTFTAALCLILLGPVRAGAEDAPATVRDEERARVEQIVPGFATMAEADIDRTWTHGGQTGVVRLSGADDAGCRTFFLRTHPGLGVTRNNSLVIGQVCPDNSARYVLHWARYAGMVEPVRAAAPNATRSMARVDIPTTPKLALVIGNSDYDGDDLVDASEEGATRSSNAGYVPDLQNPLNDATDVAAALQEMGFEVRLHENADHETMQHAFSTFATEVRRRASRGGRVVVYYSGHGIGIDNESYLIPTGARLPFADIAAARTPAERRVILVNALVPERALMQIGQAGQRGPAQLFILDSCRDNPWTKQSALVSFARRFGRAAMASSGYGIAMSSGGGARPNTPVLSYATAEATPAKDGDGRNSPFAAALIARLPTAGVTIGEMLSLVSKDVAAETGGTQRPHASTDVRSGYACLNACRR